ncbi:MULTISPECIES: ANTAR domain-containing protein [Arthrobacter]|uniref:ANTAR domain-containing protein n=1 Tax=Arthrobacter oryzae TaxID=409290 RepID=A0A3N0BM75_9MICC|nr:MULTISPECIES: ANTAR domain-containing protein [Arthrobacter]QYF88709.1 ANTAR domain-containing protein [Arthrobacter sp. PAMC25284]RNL49845.1 ANTAR domain-containing protein [Arthrobacter oryzae]
MADPRLGERLQDLVLEDCGIEQFLEDFAAMSAEFATAAAGCPVLASVRLTRDREPVMMAGSCSEALALEELQDRFPGSGMESLKAGNTVVPGRPGTGPRLSRYQAAAAQRGIHGIMGIPLALDGDAAATLSFFSRSPEALDGGAADACLVFAAMAGKPLRLAVRLGTVRSLNRDLLQAMKSRTSINLASGVLMAQSRCSQAEAFDLLSKASNSRNVKLRTVAEEILRRFDSGNCVTDFST